MPVTNSCVTALLSNLGTNVTVYPIYAHSCWRAHVNDRLPVGFSILLHIRPSILYVQNTGHWLRMDFKLPFSLTSNFSFLHHGQRLLFLCVLVGCMCSRSCSHNMQIRMDHEVLGDILGI